jgi:predicted branched-subunit amino acid permease
MPVTSTWQGFRAGVVAAIGPAIGTAPWGVTFGLLAAKLALTPPQAAFMSAWMFSGTAQFVVLDFWRSPLPWLALLFGVFAVNSRYLVQGATLAPWLNQLPRWHRSTLLLGMVDISWASSLAKFRAADVRNEAADVGFMHGMQTMLYSTWLLSTLAGLLLPLGGLDLKKWGFDFAISAILIGMVAAHFKLKSSWLPWLVALSVAYATRAWLGGHWYVLAGGIAGALVAAWRAGQDDAPAPAQLGDAANPPTKSGAL